MSNETDGPIVFYVSSPGNHSVARLDDTLNQLVAATVGQSSNGAYEADVDGRYEIRLYATGHEGFARMLIEREGFQVDERLTWAEFTAKQDAELTSSAKADLKNVGVAVPAEETVRSVARRFFGGLDSDVQGPNELSVERFIARMTQGGRTVDMAHQFAERVHQAVTDARRDDSRMQRSDLDRYNLETSRDVIEALAPSLELKTTDGSELEPTVAQQLREAVTSTVIHALDSPT